MKANALVRVNPILTELAACLCAGLAEDGQTATCFCGVVSGQNIINDQFAECDGSDGMAWVRLAGSYPAETTGEASTRKQNLKLGLGFDIELGIQRTLVADDRDGSVTEAAAAVMVTQEVLDMKTLFQAVGCCSSLADIDVIVGAWTPIGPQGMAYGGQLTIFGFIP